MDRDDTKLSIWLLLHDFWCAFGSTELKDDQFVYVGKGEPRSYGLKDNILAVFDEEGRPWIVGNPTAAHMPDGIQQFDVSQLAVRLGLTESAYVPHTGDNGQFVFDVFPGLVAGEA